jgi:lipopolysaccharide biosynthesis regulator YciM
MRRFCTLAIALALAACAQSARESLDEARLALAESRYADAIATADTGLAGNADAVTAWGLELVKLEALARDGRGDDTLAQLEKLAGSRPEQMPANQYSATADQLRAAGQGPAAILALDAGLKRFPDDQTLLALIEEAKTAPAPGSDELEMLRSLGYVD